MVGAERAAILYAGRSALHLGSALHQPGKDSAPKGPVHVAVDWTRRVAPQPGIRIHRVRELEDRVHGTSRHLASGSRWPRWRRPTGRRTTSRRSLPWPRGRVTAHGGRPLHAEIERRGRLRRRALLTELLADLERGTHSVLEHGYLVRVLRPHGLPEPTSQQKVVEGGAVTQYRDAAHAELNLSVELDGQLHDGSEARDEDADRDLDDLARGKVTPRLRYRQVFATPCRTASRLAELFRGRGWEGLPHACGAPGCPVGQDERGTSS